MKSLKKFIYESWMETYKYACTLHQFFEIYKKFNKGTVSELKREFINNLNKYSDGGPNKEDWFDSNQNTEIKLEAHEEQYSGKQYFYIVIHTKQYDDMKMCFLMKDASDFFEWFKSQNQ